MADDDLGPAFDFDALAPSIDERAARALFDRRRARARRRRRAALGGLAVAVVGVLAGAVAFVGGGEAARTPVVADGGEAAATTTATTAPSPAGLGEGCAGLRVTGPVPDGFSASLAADGELTDGAGRAIEVRHLAVRPAARARARAVEVPWFPDCWLELVADSITQEELDAFVEGMYLIGPDRSPMLDPRGAVWPETAQVQVLRSLPDERLSAYETAFAFAREVLGWDDVVEEEVAEPAHNGCDTTVYVRRASHPDRSLGVDLALSVGRRWWSVCAQPVPDPGLSVRVEGATVVVSSGLEAPAGAGSASVRVDYGGRVVPGGLGMPVDLGFTPTTTGSVVVLYRDVESEVVAIRELVLPPGDVTIGEPPAPVLDRAPVVVGPSGILGWWDGDSWHDLVDPSVGVPYAAGDEFTVVGVGAPLGSSTAGELVPIELCGIGVRLEPAPWDPDDPAPAPLAVRASPELFPRRVGTLDPADHEQAVAAFLRDAGIDGAPVRVTAAFETDLDGDGAGEVVVVASHPDADVGSAPRAGWYSVVLVVTDAATVPLRATVFTEDFDEYPTMALHAVTAVADLNGDSRMELATHTRYFEGTEDIVHEVVLGVSRPVLSSGYCGA